MPDWWNTAWTLLSIIACAVTVVVSARIFQQQHDIWRWTPIITGAVCLWWVMLLLAFYSGAVRTIPPEWGRPSIFALVMVALALLVGYRRNGI